MSEPSVQFWQGKRVAVTGGAGFLGSTVVDKLRGFGAEVSVTRSADADLRIASQAREALAGNEVIFNLAANVGGIGYNRENPAPLLRDNCLIAINVFDAARDLGVEKLVSAGSVCSYPKFTPVPFSEDEIWNGYPEETNAPYGIAKRVAQELTQTYRAQYGLNAVMPILANLYGPGDNFDLKSSHVIPALVRKFVDAAERDEPTVTLWGTGNASREFLYVDDAATALILAAEKLETPAPVNIGTGRETRIRDLAELIRRETGFEGELIWDTSQPDGQPSRSLDVSRAKSLMGFEAQTALEDGIRETIAYWKSRQ